MGLSTYVLTNSSRFYLMNGFFLGVPARNCVLWKNISYCLSTNYLPWKWSVMWRQCWSTCKWILYHLSYNFSPLLCWKCPWTAWPWFVHCNTSFLIYFNDITHCWEIQNEGFTYFTINFTLLSQQNNSISQRCWKFSCLGRHYLPFKYKRKLRSSSCKIEWTLIPAMTASALFCLCFIDF